MLTPRLKGIQELLAWIERYTNDNETNNTDLIAILKFVTDELEQTPIELNDTDEDKADWYKK